MKCARIYRASNVRLKEIAEERGMTMEPVAGHLIRLKKENPDFNFKPITNPIKLICDKVEIAYNNATKGEPICTKKFYDALIWEVTYDDISWHWLFCVVKRQFRISLILTHANFFTA